jgi:hypothetical protein
MTSHVICVRRRETTRLRHFLTVRRSMRRPERIDQAGTTVRRVA